jgi:cyclic pyranopterin monophosphate synthase
VKLSHVDADGRARMVDVGPKDVTRRTAVAEGYIEMPRSTLALVSDNSGPKGDVLRTAELAGIMGAKRAAELIPLCHPLGLDNARVEATVDDASCRVVVRASTAVTARTGIEMEALTAVSVALLTIYDMLKAAGHGMEIGGIRLLEKKGGSSGDWSIASGEDPISGLDE